MQPDDVAAVELSSFQLLSMRQSPEIAVVTNVSPNHLDVHGTMEEYIAAKKNIFAHQTAFSATVLNADCAVTAGFAGEVRGECRWFSRRHPVERGAWMDGDGLLHYSADGCDTPLFPAAEIRLPGLHNVENMLAAIAAVWGLVPPEEIRRVAAAFAGAEYSVIIVQPFRIPHGVAVAHIPATGPGSQQPQGHNPGSNKIVNHYFSTSFTSSSRSAGIIPACIMWCRLSR